MAHRELPLARDMTDAEAMMWAIDRDPWLAPSGGSVTLFDQPLDPELFRQTMTHAVSLVPRLRQHVVSPLSPLVSPHWETDREFDLDWHVRRMRAPGSGSLAELVDWLVLFLQDPYDRTRPLWQYVLIDDLQDGGGALAMKMHHVVSDGATAVRLAGAYTSFERDAPVPDPVDLEALIASEPDDHAGPAELAGGIMRRPLAAGRAALDVLAHPQRWIDAGREAGGLARTAGDHLQAAGSPLWHGRSRRRAAQVLSWPFEAAHDAWTALGGTLNDLFVTAVVEAAVRYHAARGSELERLHLTFVVSTRDKTSKTSRAGGEANAFSPVPVDLPGGPMELRARFDSVRERLHAKRDDVHGGGPLAAVATVATLLPTSIVTSVARSQASHIDVATSNLPGYLGDTYVVGAKTMHTYVLGPVAATACNITLYTTAGSIDIGLHVDPAAIDDVALLRRCLDDAFTDLLAAARAV